MWQKANMNHRPLPANHEQAQQVQRAIVKIVVGMILVAVAPAIVMISIIVNNGKPIEPGKPVPEFVLRNQDNTKVSVSDFKGHWCLVYFYNESRAEGLIQARRLRDNYNAFRLLDLQLIGISYDSVPSHHEFAEKLGITHPLLSDPEGDVIQEYAAHTSMTHMTKNMSYLVDEAGIIKKVYLDLSPDEQVRVISSDVRQFKQL